MGISQLVQSWEAVHIQHGDLTRTGYYLHNKNNLFQTSLDCFNKHRTPMLLTEITYIKFLTQGKQPNIALHVRVLFPDTWDTHYTAEIHLRSGALNCLQFQPDRRRLTATTWRGDVTCHTGWSKRCLLQDAQQRFGIRKTTRVHVTAKYPAETVRSSAYGERVCSCSFDKRVHWPTYTGTVI